MFDLLDVCMASTKYLCSGVFFFKLILTLQLSEAINIWKNLQIILFRFFREVEGLKIAVLDHLF